MTRADALALGYAATTATLAATLGPSLATLGLPTLALMGLLADGVARPASGVLVPTISRAPGRPAVALTFDDGPDPVVTPQVLDLLSQRGARATFFCIGRHAEAHPALVRRIATEHELGNHSFDHARTLNFRGVAHLRAEILRGDAAIKQAAGLETSAPLLYRPPIGLKNPALAAVADQLGLRVVNWSLHSRDTRSNSPETIAKRVIERVRPGDILLFHDGHDRAGQRAQTAPALALILDHLESVGLSPTTVSDLLSLP